MVALFPDIIPIAYWLGFLLIGLHIFKQGIKKEQDRFSFLFMSIGMVYSALNFLLHYAIKIKEMLQ